MPNAITAVLGDWQIDPPRLRDETYRAPTPRERERRHALWLLSQGWSAAAVARAFDRDPHTIGTWLDDFRRAGPAPLAFEHADGSPRPRPGRPGRLEDRSPGAAPGGCH